MIPRLTFSLYGLDRMKSIVRHTLAMASTTKLQKPKTRQIHARVPLPLSRHAFTIANAEYDGSLSDYVRDLIREDKARREVTATTATTAQTQVAA